jgi:SAM-dependent methyltransferase
MTGTGTDWLAWHAEYADPDSALTRRLAVVQELIRQALHELPPGPLRVLSLCAGQGRDLLEVLAGHPRGSDVTARLVELDPRNVAVARRAAATAGLARVEVRLGDAALMDQYLDLAPADLVLVCGVFGNISHTDIEATVGHCAALCRPGGLVLWTRHRQAPDLVPRICEWFARQGFELRWLSGPAEPFGVGMHRYAGVPREPAAGVRMFSFQR